MRAGVYRRAVVLLTQVVSKSEGAERRVWSQESLVRVGAFRVRVAHSVVDVQAWAVPRAEVGAPIRTVPQALRARPAIMAVLVRVVSVARWAALSKGCRVEAVRLVEARSLSNRRRVGNDATPKERHAVSCHCRKQPNDIEWARSI